MVTNHVVPKSLSWKETIPFHTPFCPWVYSSGQLIQSNLNFGFLRITSKACINMLYLLFLFSQFKTLTDSPLYKRRILLTLSPSSPQ